MPKNNVIWDTETPHPPPPMGLFKYLNIITRPRVGYELAIIISYPTNATGKIFFLKRSANIQN